MTDSVSSPLSVIDSELLSLFERGKTADSDTHLSLLFDNVDETAIPLLTHSAIKSGSLPANSLVKYRCFVQDMLDIEYYSSIFKTSSGELLFSKYRDRISTSSSVRGGDLTQIYDELEDVGVNGERVPLVCVPIPGESEWVHGAPSPLGVTSDLHDSSHCVPGDSSPDEEESISKRQRRVDAAYTTASAIENRTCCLLKIYDNMSTGDDSPHSTSSPRPVRLNDMLEVIGIYSADDTHELLGTVSSGSGVTINNTPLSGLEEMLLADEQEDLDEGGMEMDHMPPDVQQERMYPAAHFPRVHCLRFRVLSSTHPFADFPSPVTAITSASDDTLSTVTSVESKENYHEQVVAALQTVFLGDRLAAEYTALMLISRTGLNSAQQSEVEHFGNLNLNLCEAVSDDAAADFRIARLSTFLKELLPRSTLVEVNIDSLNSNTLFVSKLAKGGGLQRTDQSLLQLGGGTAVVLDESRMGEGVLQGGALKNIRALKELLNDQKLLVECNYYDIHVPTDVSAIIFSKASSILSTSATIQLPLQSMSTATTSSPMDVDDSGASDFASPVSCSHGMREWWAVSRMRPKPSMDAAVVQAAERDFLHATTAGRVEETEGEVSPAVTSSVLHRWILTAQLVALADGAAAVSMKHWAKMKEMESQLQLRR